jgi:hypothetical protein
VSDQLNANEIIAAIKDQLAEMEERLLSEIRKSRKAGRKPEFQSPFLRQKQAIELLGARSVLEACERAGWFKASARQPRLVLYRRTDVEAAVYRISRGEYP